MENIFFYASNSPRLYNKNVIFKIIRDEQTSLIIQEAN